MNDRYDVRGGRVAAQCAGMASAWRSWADDAANAVDEQDAVAGEERDSHDRRDERSAAGFAALAALRAVSGGAAPGDCAALALAAGRALGHADGIATVQSAALGALDGALYRSGTNAWSLFHADSLSAADARFMIAFLLGRYALHDGVEGGRRSGTSSGVFEIGTGALDAFTADDGANARAYAFATRLLMPLDTFRPALAGSLDLELVARYAQTHGLPALHVVRRWLSYTADNALLVLGEHGAIRAVWASETACGEGLPGPLRSGGAPGLPDDLAEDTSGRLVDGARWFGAAASAERLTEMTLHLDREGVRTLTLLRLRAPTRRADASAGWPDGMPAHGLARSASARG